LAASALPAASVAALVIVAVYCVPPARLAVGVNVAVLPLTFTEPITAPPPAVGRKVKLAPFKDALVIASEKVADTDAFSVMPVALFAGDVADTVGGVVSRPAPVVNFQVKSAASALPASSVAAVLMVALYCVVAVRLDVGVNVAVLPVSLMVPITAAPPAEGVSEKLAVFNVELFIGVEKVADTEEFSVTLLAPFAGDVEETVGGVALVVFAVTTSSSAVRPPHPNSVRLARRTAEYMPAEILDLMLSFDMCKAWRI
jgi:hypothetical protein